MLYELEPDGFGGAEVDRVRRQKKIAAALEWLAGSSSRSIKGAAKRFGIPPMTLRRWALKSQVHRTVVERPKSLSLDEMDVIKQRIEHDKLYLAREVLGYGWNPQAGEGISSPPDRVHREMVDFHGRPERYKLQMYPRGTHKTTLLQIVDTIQDLCISISGGYDESVMLGGETWQHSRKSLMEIKHHLLSNPILRKIYGPFAPERDYSTHGVGSLWNQDYIYIRQRKKITKEPSVVTTGVGCDPTGWHPRRIKLDDLEGRKTTTTFEQKQKIIDFVIECINLAGPSGFINLIGTPWCNDGVYAHIIKNWTGKGDSTSKHNLFMMKRMGMIEDGESIFPTKFSLAKINELRETMPLHTFARQIMCDLSAEGMSLVSAKALEAMLYDVFMYEKHPGYEVYITIDPGVSMQAKKSYTGIVCGIPVAPYDLYIDHAEKIRVEPDGLIRRVLEICNFPQYQGHVRKVAVEQRAFQKIYKGSLMNEFRRVGLTIKVEGVEPDDEKDNRIWATEPYLRHGQVHVRNTLRDFHWDLVNFPNISKGARDTLDAFAYLFQILPRSFILNPYGIIKLKEQEQDLYAHFDTDDIEEIEAMAAAGDVETF